MEVSARQAAREALLIVSDNLPPYHVGGLGLVDRWTRGLERSGIQTRLVRQEDLQGGVPASECPILVVEAGCVLDYDALNFLGATRVADRECLSFRDDQGRPVPAMLWGPDAPRRQADFESGEGWLPWKCKADRIVDLPGGSWPMPRSQQEANAITRSMLARLRLRPGGLIARHVNRRFSTRWTYWLLKTPLTPDQITTIAGLMAIVAAGILSFPGWIYGVLGALLMQISSILDGCDGEVARIRYQQTEFGKWYDSAWDEVVNALFLVALGMHVASTEGPAWNGARWLGAFSGLATFLYGAANFHCKWVHGIGLYWWFDTPPAPRAPDEPPPPTTWWSELKTLTGRDAYLLLILLGAVIGALPWLLIAFTALSAVFFLLLLIHISVARGKW